MKGRFEKGQIPWNKGKKGWTKGTKAGFQKAEKNFKWKGKKVKYFGLHKWVLENKGKAITCEMCGEKNNIQWANKSHCLHSLNPKWLYLLSDIFHLTNLSTPSQSSLLHQLLIYSQT